MFHFKFESLDSEEESIILREESSFVHIIQLFESAFGVIIFQTGGENLAQSLEKIWSIRVVTLVDNDSHDSDLENFPFFSHTYFLLNAICPN